MLRVPKARRASAPVPALRAPLTGQLLLATRPHHLPKPREASPRCRHLRVTRAASPRPMWTDLPHPRAPKALSFHPTPARVPFT